MLPPREVNWAILIGCFGSTQWTGEYCRLSLKGVELLARSRKAFPILARKRQKSHIDFFVLLYG